MHLHSADVFVRSDNFSSLSERLFGPAAVQAKQFNMIAHGSWCSLWEKLVPTKAADMLQA